MYLLVFWSVGGNVRTFSSEIIKPPKNYTLLFLLLFWHEVNRNVLADPLIARECVCVPALVAL